MSIFNKFLQKAKRFTSPEPQAIPAITPENPRKIDEYWLELITQSELIDKAHIETVLKHYQGRINLSKGIKLTVDEKKILNFNTRLSITKELLSVLNEKGKKQTNPKCVLKNLRNQGTLNYLRDNTLIKDRKLSFIKEYKIDTVLDGRSCPWCVEQNGNFFDISVDINELIKNNCSCVEHCRLGIRAVLPDWIYKKSSM